MASYHLNEPSSDSLYDNYDLADLVPTTSIRSQEQFSSNHSNSNYHQNQVIQSPTESSFRYRDSSSHPFTSSQDSHHSPLPPPSSRSSNSRVNDFLEEQQLNYPPSSHLYNHSLHSPQLNRPQSYQSHHTYNPPSSQPHSSSSSLQVQDLPEFSRWSPTWISGGYSLDGRSYATQAAHLSSGREENLGRNWQIDPYSTNNDFDVGGGGRKEWDGKISGEYRHGVGFKDGTIGKSKKKLEREVAERMRKLQREFGDGGEGEGNNFGGEKSLNAMSMKERIEFGKAEKKKEKLELVERSGVDSKGRLVVSGPKKRAIIRWIQALGTIGVGFGSIGAAILTHPISPPPPASKPPLYLLYLLPFLSLFLTIYLFLIRPCLLRKSKKFSSTQSNSTDPNNPFMIPLLYGNSNQSNNNDSRSGCCGCFGSRKKNTKGLVQPQTINLMMDPRMFPHLNRDENIAEQNVRERERKRRRGEKESEKRKKEKRRERKRDSARGRLTNENAGDFDSEDSTTTSSGAESISEDDAWSISDPNTSKSNRTNQRKNLLSSIVLESRWREARSWLKKITVWDIVASVIWSAVGIYAIGFGEKCKPGSFEGWCDFYNSSLALAVITSLAFFTSFVLDILDLRRTSVSPRLLQQRLSPFP